MRAGQAYAWCDARRHAMVQFFCMTRRQLRSCACHLCLPVRLCSVAADVKLSEPVVAAAARQQLPPAAPVWHGLVYHGQEITKSNELYDAVLTDRQVRVLCGAGVGADLC